MATPLQWKLRRAAAVSELLGAETEEERELVLDLMEEEEESNNARRRQDRLAAMRSGSLLMDMPHRLPH